MSTNISGRTALVTGASSGLGVDFARSLASRGASLILVARRRERLEEVAQELRQSHGVRVDVLAHDLGVTNSAASLAAALGELGLEVDILVNNAGFGMHGDFIEQELERVQQMIQLDIVTLTDLSHLFGRRMANRRWGRILQVASIGAYQACPTYAVYGAAKSYVLHFSEALDFELRGSGVHCTTISPGVTATEFLEVAGQKPTLYQRLMMMTSPQVAEKGVRAMLKGRRSVIPGVGNLLGALAARLTPRSLGHWIAYQTMRPEA